MFYYLISSLIDLASNIRSKYICNLASASVTMRAEVVGTGDRLF